MNKKFGPLDHEVAMTINMLLRDLTLKEFSWFDWRTKNKNNLRDLTLQEFSGLDQSLKILKNKGCVAPLKDNRAICSQLTKKFIQYINTLPSSIVYTLLAVLRCKGVDTASTIQEKIY